MSRVLLQDLSLVWNGPTISHQLSRNFTGFQLNKESAINYVSSSINVFTINVLTISANCLLIFLTYPTDRHLIRSASDNKLNVPRTRLHFGERAFAVAGAREWNLLPTELRSIDDFNIFKAKLKTYLFNIAFNQWHSVFQLLLFSCFNFSYSFAMFHFS